MAAASAGTQLVPGGVVGGGSTTASHTLQQPQNHHLALQPQQPAYHNHHQVQGQRTVNTSGLKGGGVGSVSESESVIDGGCESVIGTNVNKKNNLNNCNSVSGTSTSTSLGQPQPNLVSGWKRLINNGDIVYLSPSGDPLRSISQIKDYLLTPGTCKCELPCPIRPELFFNFDSQIPNLVLQAGTSVDGSGNSSKNFGSSSSSGSSGDTSRRLGQLPGFSCLHQQRLLLESKGRSLVHKDITVKRRKLGTGEWSSGTVTLPTQQQQPVVQLPQTPVASTSTSSSSASAVPQWNIQIGQQQPMTTKQPRSIGAKVTAVNSNNDNLQRLGPQSSLGHNNIVLGSNFASGTTIAGGGNSAIGGTGSNSTSTSANGTKVNSGINILSNTQLVPPLSQRPGGQVQYQSQTAAAAAALAAVATSANGNLISANNVIQSGNNNKNTNNNSGTTPTNNNNNISYNQIIGLNPGHHNNTNNNTSGNHNNNTSNNNSNGQGATIIETIGGGGGQLQSTQNVAYAQHPNARTTTLKSTSSSSSTLSTSTTGGTTLSNLQLSKSPPWKKKDNNVQMQQQPQMVTHVVDQRVPPLPQQHLVVSHQQHNQPPWQEETQKRMLKIRQQNTYAGAKKRPNFKDDPTGYLDHQTAILHSSIMNVHSPDIDNESASTATTTVVASETAGRLPQQPQQEATNGLKLAEPMINSFPIGGQTVTHLPNGMVQVAQNCDMVQHRQQLQQMVDQMMQQQQQQQQQQQIQNQMIRMAPTKTIVVQSSQESPVSSSTTLSGGEKSSGSSGSQDQKGPVQGGTISTSNDSPASFAAASPMSCASESSESADVQQQQQQQQQQPPPPPHQVQKVPKTYKTKMVGSNQTTLKYAKPVHQLLQQKPLDTMKASGLVETHNTVVINPAQTSHFIDNTTNVLNKVTMNVQQQAGQHQHPIFITDANGQSQRIQPIMQNCIPMATSLSGLPGNQFVMNANGQIIVMPQAKAGTTFTTANASGLITTAAASTQNILIGQGNHHHQHQAGQSTTTIHQHHPANVIIQNGHHHHNHQQQAQHHQAQHHVINTINGNIISGLDLDHQSRNVMIPTGQNGTTIQIANATHSGASPLIINSATAANCQGAKIISPTMSTQGHHQILATTNNGTVTLLNTMPSGFVIQPTAQATAGAAGGTTTTILQPAQQHHTATTIDGHQVLGQLIDTGNGTQQFIQTTHLQQPQAMQHQGRVIIAPSPDQVKIRKGKKRKSSSSSSSASSTSSSSTGPSPQTSPTILSPNQQHHQQPLIQITSPTYPQSFQISPGIPQLTILPNQQHSAAATAKALTPTGQQATHQQILLQNGQTILQPINLIGQQLIMPAGLVMTTAPAAPENNTLLQIQNMGHCGGIQLTPQGMMIRAQSPQTNKGISTGFLSPNSAQQFIVTTTPPAHHGQGTASQISPQQLGHIYSTPMGLMMPAQQQQHNTTRTFVTNQQHATIIQHQQQQQQQHHLHHQQILTTRSMDNATVEQVIQQHQQQQQQQQQQSQMQESSHRVAQSSSASPPDTTTHSPQSPERPLSQRSGGSDSSNMVQCVSSSEPDSMTIIPLSETTRVESPSSVGEQQQTQHQQQRQQQHHHLQQRQSRSDHYEVPGGSGGGGSMKEKVRRFQQGSPSQHPYHKNDLQRMPGNHTVAGSSKVHHLIRPDSHGAEN